MPDQTASDWPYPLGTDRVMDGDDMMKATADLLEDRVGGGFASGLVIIDAPSALDTPVRAHVNLPAGLFTAPPNVIVGLFATAPGHAFVAVDRDTAGHPVSKDEFWVLGSRSVGPLGDIGCYWIAHQPGA